MIRNEKELTFAFESLRKPWKIWERVNPKQMSFKGFTDDLIWFVAGQVLADCQKKHLYAIVLKLFGRKSGNVCRIQRSTFFDDK